MSGALSVLTLTDVTKTYPGVRALKGVSVDVRAGEVHALVGENGAGKSTLMGVASGATVPDSGSVRIGGETLDAPTPARAEQLGLAIVYQHPAVVPDLTVAENILLSCPRSRRPPRGRRDVWVKEQLAALDAPIKPGGYVRELSLADRQLVEIARALSREPKVLVLDEPTEPLLAAEIERLFERVRAIAALGAGVVYISHRLPEVQRIADRISVLRDGELRGTFEASRVTEREIVALIAGRTLESTFPPKRAAGAHTDTRLRVRGLSGAGFDEIELEVATGEVIGLAGVEGNGQREFLRGLAGVLPTSGTVEVDGAETAVSDPASARSGGIVYVAGDRHAEGLFMPAGVKDNLTATSLGGRGPGWLSESRLRQRASEQVRRLEIRTPSLDAALQTLSGGNQQKVAIGRSLLETPRVLLLDGPTQGVDIGSRVEIYRIVREAAEQGCAVVVLSSDGLELEGLCDRVAIFSRGRIAAELSGDQLTEQNLIDRALTATAQGARAHTGAGSWRLWSFLGGDFTAAAAVLIVTLLVVLYTALSASTFLTEETFQTIFVLIAVLGFAAIAQQIVVLVGGIDLSVGPSLSLLVVLASFFITPEKVLSYQLFGVVVLLGAALVVGAGNGVMAEAIGMPPVIATLVSYIILQGVGLLLRPLPQGTIDPTFTDALGTQVGPVPVMLIVAIVCAVGLDLMIRQTRWGVSLRAVGSDQSSAHRLGVRVKLVRFSAYTVAGVFVFLGALCFLGQVGIGTAGAGLEYTLSSITAVVLGGAAIAGGRGAFVGGLIGAALIEILTNAVPFLQLSDAWQQWFLGGLILISALAYSTITRVRARGA